MIKKIENLFLIAGTGRNSGKTTMVCRVIRQFSHLEIISVKISPHFHEPSPGLVTISENENYIIYEETDSHSGKDTSRMLQCGSKRVFYVLVKDGNLESAFDDLIKYLPPGNPVVCESPALIRYAEPGVFVLMISEESAGRKDMPWLNEVARTEYSLVSLNKTEVLPFRFYKGKWLRTGK